MTLSDGLLLFWNMQHLTPAGFMQDQSGNGLHGTMDILPADEPDGFHGRARRWTAPLQRVVVGGGGILDITDENVTLAYAMKGDISAGIGFGPGKSGSYTLARLTTDTFRAQFSDGLGGTTEAETGVKDEIGWFHVVGICRAGLAEIYVNGVLEAEDLVGPLAMISSIPGNNFRIGEVTALAVADEVMLWGRAISSVEVLELFNSYFTTSRATTTTQVGLQS